MSFLSESWERAAAAEHGESTSESEKRMLAVDTYMHLKEDYDNPPEQLTDEQVRIFKSHFENLADLIPAYTDSNGG